jgi:phage terminase large subunit-like protein
MASNVAIAYGPNAQIKPDRQRSGEKIDGIIALVEALDGAMREPREEKQDFKVEWVG